MTTPDPQPDLPAAPGSQAGASSEPVAALFVRSDSVYKSMAGVDAYDAERDARTFPGGMPIVAHPPCRAWSSLKAFSKPPPGERRLAVWSVLQIRRHGGVLEHPKGSSLWRVMQLPKPGWLPDQWGGYTMEVDQYHWGHKARKRTWLYICGTRQPPPSAASTRQPDSCDRSPRSSPQGGETKQRRQVAVVHQARAGSNATGVCAMAR